MGRGTTAMGRDTFSCRTCEYHLKCMVISGGYLIGNELSLISGALLHIREKFPEVQRSTSLQGIIVSVGVAGAVLGSALGIWTREKFGRRPTCATSDILIFLGALLGSFARGPWLIIAGRLVSGTGLGLAIMTVPLYISEVFSPQKRETYLKLNDMMIVTGQLMAYLTLDQTPKISSLHSLFGMQAVIGLTQIFYWTCWLPESPWWLYRMNKKKDACNVLKQLHSGSDFELEVQTLKSLREEELLVKDSSDMLIKVKDPWGASLLSGIGLCIFQQLVGINMIIYYGPSILQIAGVSSNDKVILYSLMIWFLGTLASFIGMDKVDSSWRKKLMVISMVGIIACLAVLVGIFTVCGSVATPDAGCPSKAGKVVLALFALYVICYSVGVEIIPEAVSSEMYPLACNSIVSGILKVVLCQGFLTLSKAIGPAFTFVVLCGISILALVYIIWIVPQPEGLRFDEV